MHYEMRSVTNINSSLSGIALESLDFVGANNRSHIDVDLNRFVRSISDPKIILFIHSYYYLILLSDLTARLW